MSPFPAPSPHQSAYNLHSGKVQLCLLAGQYLMG